MKTKARPTATKSGPSRKQRKTARVVATTTGRSTPSRGLADIRKPYKTRLIEAYFRRLR